MGTLGWSATPAQNGVADPTIPAHNGASGRELPGLVRSVMAGVRRYADAQGGALVTEGRLNAYTVDTGLGVAELRPGIALIVRVDRDNTAEATLNVDGLGPLPWVDAGGVRLQVGRILKGRFYAVILDFADDGVAAWRVQAGASTLSEIPGFEEARDATLAASTIAVAKAGEASGSAATASARAAEAALRASEVETARAQVAANAITVDNRANAVAADRSTVAVLEAQTRATRDQMNAIAASEAGSYDLASDLPASGVAPLVLRAYVNADPGPSPLGTRIGFWTRATSTSAWTQKSTDTVSAIAARTARLENGVKPAGAALGFERATDSLRWGWRRYDWSVNGFYLMGGINREGLAVIHDGLGTAEANYKVAIPDSVPLAQVAATAKFAEGARGFEVATDALRWGWQRYDWSLIGGYLIGGINRLGIPVRHDGLGTTEEHYLSIGGTATASAIALPRLPLVALAGTSRGEAYEAAKVAALVTGPNPPNPLWSNPAKPAYARPPFAVLQATPANRARYAQFEARGCFSGERFGTQTLASCYGSEPVAAGVNPEGKGRGTAYRVNGTSKVLDPILFLIPDNYPDGPSYCNNVHLFKLPEPDGRALLTCPVAGGGGYMTAWAFILHNPETVGTLDANGNVILADCGPPCIIGYGWCGVPSRSFGSDLLMTVSTINNYETGKGLMLKRLYLFGERNDRIHSVTVATLPNAPQDVPIEQGVVVNTFYEASAAALPAERPGDPPSGGMMVTMRAESGVGEAGGQFWTRSHARGRLWELPFRAPFPTVGAQTELTNDPDGDLIFVFNRSSTERRDLCVAIHIGGDVALRSSWVETVIDPRGSGATTSLSYFRPFFPTDAIGRWMSNKPIHIWGDMGRNKDADGPDPAVPGKNRGWGMLYTINKADLLKGSLASLTITEYPTHQPV